MAGGKSATYKNNILTWALTATAVTRPTSWTIALYSDTGGATEVTTSNCPGYARQTATFGTASGGAISNTNDIAFTATGAWVAVQSMGVIDNSGNQIYWAPLSTSRTLQVSGDKIDFAIGQITINEA